jgi:hypothetical protein
MGFSDIFNGGGNQTQMAGTAIGTGYNLPTTNAGIQNAASQLPSTPSAGINSLGNASLNTASTTALGMGLGSNPVAAQQMQQLQEQQQKIMEENGSNNNGRNVGQRISGALGGFGQGAMAGSMFGPVGALIGGGIGALGNIFS